jgi:hypothetical protein
MSLSYHFGFRAAAEKTSAELENFLRRVEKEALKMGFNPTLVFNAPFDTKERWEFARWFTTGLKLENEKLRGVILLREGQVWSHDPVTGFCFVIPRQGVLLVVTNEQGHETVFGFLRYPANLLDLNGKQIAETGAGDWWTYRSFVDTSDQRYRLLVKLFKDAGYLESEKDEYRP